ncbi:hypothetical protein [Ochrobactrum sp. BTU1]|uniref:hypothetical protein n=1 Tax=Ochrobactrum sp. BTU1 TaxID=2840456 RepID=UPI001C0580D5|nr:hypothetical protein KMS41_21415 [Ochrobactrum sp. BTU1]
MLIGNLIRTVMFLFIVITAQTVKASELNELDLKIVDVVNRYSAATKAVKLCGRYIFNNKAQEKIFISNSNLSKIYASRIFLKQFPTSSQSALTVKAEEMDRKLETAINRFYTEEGCSHRLIKKFIEWFDNLRQAPLAPYPKPDISDKEFEEMGMRWIILNDQL